MLHVVILPFWNLNYAVGGAGEPAGLAPKPAIKCWPNCIPTINSPTNNPTAKACFMTLDRPCRWPEIRQLFSDRGIEAPNKKSGYDAANDDDASRFDEIEIRVKVHRVFYSPCLRN
jgi:hypothetical protein